MKPTIMLLVGGQNSGKSTAIDGLVKAGMQSGMTWHVLSRDAIREAYAEKHSLAYQDTFPLTDEGKKHNETINQKFTAALDDALSQGQNIIIDNTNMTAADRAGILNRVKASQADYDKEALIFDIPIEEALRRNAARDKQWQDAGKPERAIPDFVIRSTYEKFDPPSTKEGFDRVSHAKVKQVNETGASGALGRQ